MNKARHLLPALALLTLMPACGSVPERNPVPESLVDVATIPGTTHARFWGDAPMPWAAGWVDASPEELAEQFAGIMNHEHSFLAISGGGENGAFGAGLLRGWSESGTRPEFTIVTGISTGALTAPFAFLGPEYDGALEEIYTTYRTEDLIEERGILTALTSDAFYDSSPFRELIGKYFDDDLLRKVATEHAKGRRLFISTTNLDTARPVVWSIGALVESGLPEHYELARDVLLASASIPAAFPPVLIEVEAGGARYDEIHVDGGATSQVFLLPLGLDWGKLREKLAVVGNPDVYIIRNACLQPKWDDVDPPGVVAISARSMSSLIRTQGIGDMYRIYLGAIRDGFDYHVATIPDDFDEPQTEFFDPVYMRTLYDVGQGLGRIGTAWRNAPPGVELEDS